MPSFSMRVGVGVLLIAGSTFGFGGSQEKAVPAAGADPAAAKSDKPPFKQEELDQLLAPIALHPDDLLSQILIASTYPIEIVQAERWLKANATVKGDALAKALETQTWDPSVRSLVNVPQVLTMMSEKIDWTVNLGNAFLGQQKAVMDTVQQLRQKAKEAGNLESSKEQKVSTEEQEGTTVIVIESAEPEVIYVPTYNPSVMYGSWPYPAYPPYYWYPPAYVPPPYPAFHFGVGLAIGVAWGYAWGGCSWGHSEVDIDIDRNTEFNRNIDRGKHAQQLQDRAGTKGGKGSWRHDPSHRQGVAYRDSATAKKVGGPSVSDTARSRDAFRGRTDPGAAGASNRATQQPAAGNRAGSDRPSTSDRSTSGSGRTNAFEGAKQSGRETRSASDRGRSSRSSSPTPSARPRSSGGSRGGSRGGGRRG